MKSNVGILTLALVTTAFASGVDPAGAPATAPRVQIALLLDTSNSMDGLINQARTQLWSIVNEFNTAHRGGIPPVLEVALFEYGNNSIADRTTWVRRVQPFTRDLDAISRDLFALRTNGGEEYCGAAIKEASDTLTWSTEPGVYKAIFVAGNEPFTQGPIAPADVCRSAAARNIIVNTIHCGTEHDGLAGGWKNGAVMGDGSYIVINQDKVAPHIDAPQDKEIARLSLELNKTYIAYGKEGAASCANQSIQDRNATTAAPAAELKRAVTKASANYWNASWDLVDACRTSPAALDSIKKEDLSADLAKLTKEELAAYVAAQAKARADLQARIVKLNAERELAIAEAIKATAATADTLESAVTLTIRAQATKAGLTFRSSVTATNP